LCLACRGCEAPAHPACNTASWWKPRARKSKRAVRCAARGAWLRRFVFGHLLQSPALMTVARRAAVSVPGSGLQKLVRGLGFLKLLGKLGEMEQLAPPAEPPFFFSKIGKTFPGRRRAALPRGASWRGASPTCASPD
jgi:glycolate oxidase iron-sulfur subunit